MTYLGLNIGMGEGRAARRQRWVTMIGAAVAFTAAAALINQLARGGSWVGQAVLFMASVFAFTVGLAIEEARANRHARPEQAREPEQARDQESPAEQHAAPSTPSRQKETPPGGALPSDSLPGRYDFRVDRTVVLWTSIVFVPICGIVFWYAYSQGAWDSSAGFTWVRLVGRLSLYGTAAILAMGVTAGFGYPRLRIDQLGVHYIPGLGRRSVFPWAELTDVAVHGGKLVGHLRPGSQLARHKTIRKCWRNKLGGYMMADLEELVATPEHIQAALVANGMTPLMA